MKVTNWIEYDEDNMPPESIGSMGGWFNANKYDNHTWKDYEAIWPQDKLPYVLALKEEILREKIRTTGQQHQYSDGGVPVFEDNTIAFFSYRGWGDLMAAIWSEADGKRYWYMDFYC